MAAHINQTERMKELPASIRIDVYCPACYGTPKESWPQKVFLFPHQPMLTGQWYDCATCRKRIPWDQWLVVGGDFDVCAIGPIGGLPSLGSAINAITQADDPPPPPTPSKDGGYLVKGPTWRVLHGVVR